MDYGKLELKLRKIVEKRLEEGWSIGPVGLCSYFDYRGVAQCCAIGSVVADHPSIGFFDVTGTAARKLGTSANAVQSIAGGFEGGPIEDHIDEKAYEIGARIRRDYCEYEDGK